MKLVNMSDLKSDAERLPGASPGARTKSGYSSVRLEYRTWNAGAVGSNPTIQTNF